MRASLTVVSGIFPPDPGGPAKFANEFGAAMTENYCEVRIVAYGSHNQIMGLHNGLKLYSVSRAGSLGKKFTIFIVNLRRVISGNSTVLAVGAFIETYISSLLFGFRYVAKVPGDIVWERARNNGITSLGIQEYQQEKLSFKYRLFRFMYTRSLKRAEKVIVPSRGLQELCLAWGIKQERIELVHNGIDIESFSTLKVQTPEYDVITVCRLTSWKGVDELILSCARNNLKLLVVGDGPVRERLEKVAADSEADVTFKGDVSAENIPALLGLAKMFVLNSYYEGLPHALLEARAARIFTIARADTGSAEVIHNKLDGLLLSETFTLDVALNYIFENPNETKHMVNCAFEDVKERFDKFKNYESIYSILESTQ